ncbi:type VII secretion protein EccE [Candidatus Mycobacterium methanotrophicum]|uniref:Type VII secretion protein EccE n=1 Tax=Candidatus Mycobacterium methanotrophicum TaxID=2943498 RepID=A0ABY4QHA8_9MYCO|nr:type VII secretion protein EccE [Candidatus Mycobacterium methanotrophicum]UQX09919.1 type VII secretion protein EccE [Candidatus Mycobacterium methanotrophicum]
MKAQREYGLDLSWPRVTAVFLIDVALLVIASHCPASWQAGHAAFWVGVGLAAFVTIVALVTNGGVPIASAPLARVRNWYADPEALTVGCTPAIDHRRRFSRETVGVREYDGRLIAVIGVEGAVDTASGRHGHRDTLPATMPLDAVIEALRQFDVRLDSVDIVSVGTRRASKGVKSAVQDDFGSADDRDPLDERNTWLVLRMDPLHNVQAVATRDSVASTLAAATERLAHDLDGRSCTARPLTADEITDVDHAVLAGLQPAHIRPYWRYLKTPDGFVTSFWVSPCDITSETLQELWLPDADVTVVTIRLIADGREADVAAWVRYHSDKRLHKETFNGLNRLTGRQLGAVAASIPAPSSRRALPMPSRILDDGEGILVPVGAVYHQQMSQAEALR